MEELRESMPNVYAVIVALGEVIKRIDIQLANGHSIIVNREYIIERRYDAYCLIECRHHVDPRMLIELGIACFDELPSDLCNIYSKMAVNVTSFSKYSQLDVWVKICLLYSTHNTFILKNMILVFRYFAKLEALLVDDSNALKLINYENFDTLISQVKLLEQRELWMHRRGLKCQSSALSTLTTTHEMRYYPVSQTEDSKL